MSTEKVKMPVRDKKGRFTGAYVEQEPVRGFKGYDKNLRCLDKQYKVGATFTESGGRGKVCEPGMMHFCKDLRHVFVYYPPSRSGAYCCPGLTRYTRVKALGPVKTAGDKLATKKLYVDEELSLPEVAEIVQGGSTYAGSCNVQTHYGSAAFVKAIAGTAIAENAKSLAVTTGIAGIAICEGYNSAALSTGPQGVAVNNTTNYTSCARVEGPLAVAVSRTGGADAANYDSIALSMSKAKGVVGSWLVLVEASAGRTAHIKNVKVVKVDGKEIEADVYYTLSEGKVVRCVQ